MRSLWLPTETRRPQSGPITSNQNAMAPHDYKRPGILRAGFQYQDLVAIEVLINYYRDRDLYDWVQLDAEDSRFRSIEDVVARRPDGLYELTQVKFTVDPEAPANSLSWRWLTEIRSKRGESLLQKWASTTLNHKTAGTLAQAVLKTDRRPDPEFTECLNGTRIDYGRLPADVRTTVDQQIGSSRASKSFFDTFCFVHSQPVLDDLEEKLWSRIASDTDRGGGQYSENRFNDGRRERDNRRPTARSSTFIYDKRLRSNVLGRYHRTSWSRQLIAFPMTTLTVVFCRT